MCIDSFSLAVTLHLKRDHTVQKLTSRHATIPLLATAQMCFVNHRAFSPDMLTYLQAPKKKSESNLPKKKSEKLLLTTWGFLTRIYDDARTAQSSRGHHE
jgi:hypothetical protein